MPRNTSGRLHEKPLRRHFLKEWREARSLSRADAADAAGVTEATLSRIENLKQPFTQRTLESLAAVYKTDPASLIAMNPKDGRAPWAVWDHLTPEQKRTAARVIQALSDEG